MSASQPITYEQLLESFRQTDQQIRRTEQMIAEMGRRIDRTNSKVEDLGHRLGQLIEAMVEGGIVRKFAGLGYSFTQCARHVEFENRDIGVSGEIDLFLENGDYILAVEVKTNLIIDDIRGHIERLGRYRRYLDAKGDKRKIIAAIGGGVVLKNVKEFALNRGLYVVLQSGETVEIIKPESGEPRIW